jgi:nucleotide-binding universal stress UspA family protein
VAGRLFPEARAAVVYARSEPLALDDSKLVHAALPPSVIATIVEGYEEEAVRVTAEVAECGRVIAAAGGLDAEAVVRPGTSAWRAICDAAAELAADLIVCGSRGRGGIARALLGTTSSTLLQHAPLPLLVVPAGAQGRDGPVLIGYDGSAGSRSAVRACGRLLPGRAALVAHAWSSPLERSLAGSALAAVPHASDLDQIFAGAAAAAADEGAALARECGLAASALTVESVPGTWRALAAAAEREGAALVAVGSRGRGAAASTVLGSVSSGLVHNAALPTLVVRAAAGQEEDAGLVS